MGLFSGKRKPIEYGVINSVVGRDAVVKGEINTKGSVRIDGEFEGKVNAKGDIFVGDGSKIVGNIVGARIVVSGEINGNIIANDGLEVTKSGRVYGDITGDKLVIDEGAIYKGRVNLETASKKGMGYERSESEFEGPSLIKNLKTA